MSRRFRVVALLCVMFLVVAACSKPRTQVGESPDQDEKISALDDVRGDETEVGDTVDTGSGGRDTSGAVDAGGQGYVDLNPQSDTAQARKVASLIQVMSSSYGNPNTWAGVTKDKIKIAFGFDRTSCGVNLINAVAAAGGNLSQGTRFYRPAPTDQDKAVAEVEESIDNLVKFWNANGEDVVADAPNIIKLMEKYNTPGHPFYGRKIEKVVFDSGSYQCPERTTAGAVKAVNEIKPFVVISNDVAGIDGSGYNMAANLNAKASPDKRPMHFGSMNLSDKFYKQWAPYVWTQFVSGTAAVRAGASWMCSRLAGKKAVNAPQQKDKVRKFGLAYPNNENAKQVASELKGFMKQYCGKDMISSDSEFVFSEDPANATDQGTQMAVRFQLANVTSVIYLLDPIAPLFHMIGFAGQEYRPEFIWPSTAYTDSSTVQRLYSQDMVDKASIGISSFGQPGGFGYEAGDPFWLYHENHKKSPKTGKACDPRTNEGMAHDPQYCRAPGAIVTWYYSLLPLIGGIYFAGPDLKPLNVTKGLQAYPLTRYGADGPTSDPRAALVGAGPGQYHFIVDYSEWRWRAKYISPAPEHKDGWVEWTDCQRHYTLWPDKLAKNWEKSGSQYNAWCGNAKYAPTENMKGEWDAANHSHDGTYADGSYEKDNYPRVK